MFSLLCSMLVVMPLLVCPPVQAAGPQSAIESLERCSAQERKKSCVRILKREKLEGGKQRIKAELRGGRIIWYVYDGATGKARRTN